MALIANVFVIKGEDEVHDADAIVEVVDYDRQEGRVQIAFDSAKGTRTYLRFDVADMVRETVAYLTPAE